MTSLRLEPWRFVVDAHADQIARALEDELGPIRARDVTVGHDALGVVVTLTTGERDPMRTVWVVVVEMAQLWPALAAPVGLTVHAGDLTATTPFETMELVVDGCDYRAWADGTATPRAGRRDRR